MMLSPAAQRWLLALARDTVAQALAERGTPSSAVLPKLGTKPEERGLDQPARVFVSWHLGDRLQGCIGTLMPVPNLAEGVQRYAVMAALDDRRTPPLDPQNLSALGLEISVLSEPRPLEAVGLTAIAAKLVPHRDGVILSLAERSAFFLPVVWAQLPDPQAFLAHLCRKACIDPQTEGAECTAQLLEVSAFSDANASGE